MRELAIHHRVSRLNYSRRYAEDPAVQAYQKRGLPLAPGMEIGYVVRDAGKWWWSQRGRHRGWLLGITESFWRRLGRKWPLYCVSCIVVALYATAPMQRHEYSSKGL